MSERIWRTILSRLKPSFARCLCASFCNLLTTFYRILQVFRSNSGVWPWCWTGQYLFLTIAWWYIQFCFRMRAINLLWTTNLPKTFSDSPQLFSFSIGCCWLYLCQVCWRVNWRMTVVSISSIPFFFLFGGRKQVHPFFEYLFGNWIRRPSYLVFRWGCGCSVMEWLSWLSFLVADHGKENIGFSDHISCLHSSRPLIEWLGW